MLESKHAFLARPDPKGFKDRLSIQVLSKMLYMDALLIHPKAFQPKWREFEQKRQAATV